LNNSESEPKNISDPKELSLNVKTVACLVDEIKQNLAKIRDKSIDTSEDRKYYAKCFKSLWIGAARPTPYYDVNIGDLTPEYTRELLGLDHNKRAFVLKQIIGRIYEDINPELYHNSISRVLKVRLVP
jgi:hypothetical protein